MTSSVRESVTLHGSLERAGQLSGAISACEVLSGSLEFDASASVPVYAGEYTVRPSPQAQQLETAGRKMARNVEVEAIPLSRVSNASNGITVTIG